jgi:hypothetical protein
MPRIERCSAGAAPITAIDRGVRNEVIDGASLVLAERLTELSMFKYLDRR